MRSNLIKRLRDPAFFTETSERNLMNEAADALEVLVKERDDAIIKQAEWEIEAKTLRAKLAKAIEALQFYGDTKNYEIRWVRKDCGCCSDGVRIIPENDKGTIARAALTGLRKE